MSMWSHCGRVSSCGYASNRQDLQENESTASSALARASIWDADFTEPSHLSLLACLAWILFLVLMVTYPWERCPWSMDLTESNTFWITSVIGLIFPIIMENEALTFSHSGSHMISQMVAEICLDYDLVIPILLWTTLVSTGLIKCPPQPLVRLSRHRYLETPCRWLIASLCARMRRYLGVNTKILVLIKKMKFPKLSAIS